MKNLLHGLAFLFIFYSFSTSAQSTPDMGIGRFDTLYSKIWENGNWVNQSRIFNTYNTDCITNSSTVQFWDESRWENTIQTTFTYLPSKKVNQSFVSEWNDPDWVVFERTTNTYNPALQLTKDLTEIYVSTIWIGGSQNMYTYDANGYLNEELGQTWNGVQFQNSYKTNYLNNAGGLVVNERTQTWSGTSWENQDSTQYSFNGLNQIISALYFDWIGNQWVNSSRSTGTYVNNLLTEIIDEDWESNAWVNSSRQVLTYDSRQRVVSQVDQDWDIASQNWMNQFLNEVSYTTVCGALPLTLLSFDAEVKSAEVRLTWETADEINTSGFSVQKSRDGLNFTTIGNVKSAGGKSIHKYSFVDLLENDQSGILYYRLFMNDLDGKSSLSNVVKVKVNSRISLSLYPNPVIDQLIFVTGENIKNAAISITGQKGSTLLNQKFGPVMEGTKNSIDVSTLPAGIYIFLIKDNDKVITKKFIKR